MSIITVVVSARRFLSPRTPDMQKLMEALPNIVRAQVFGNETPTVNVQFREVGRGEINPPALGIEIRMPSDVRVRIPDVCSPAEKIGEKLAEMFFATEKDRKFWRAMLSPEHGKTYVSLWGRRGREDPDLNYYSEIKVPLS